MLKKLITIKKINTTKNFNAGKNMETSSVNSEHKHSEIEHFSMLNNAYILSENSKDSVIVNCQ